MTLNKAKDIFREFHLKQPRRILKLKTRIPRLVYPIGFGIQISYRSDKWNKDEEYMDYIHWWENKTIVCVPEEKINEIIDPRERTDFGSPIDVGPKRNEIVFLGYAIDFSIAEEDRTQIPLEPGLDFLEKYEPEDLESVEKLNNAVTFDFNPEPGSRHFVASSPSGRIVYVIDDEEEDVYAFINHKCEITRHGITG